MPLRRSPSGEAQSGETTYAGLPKAYMGYRGGSVNGYTANIWNRTYHDTISYNYGGYAFGSFVGALWSDVIIPEPGIYDLCGQVMFSLAPAGQYFAAFFINNVQPVPYTQPSINPVAGANTLLGVNQSRELKQGDAVSLQAFTTVAGVVDQAGYTWFSVIKRGGQY